MVITQNIKTITTLCEDKEVYNTLSTLIQDTDDDCSGLITSIVEYLQNKYPSEVAYQYLLYFNQYVYSTDRFKDHLSAILDKIEKLQKIFGIGILNDLMPLKLLDMIF